MKPQKEEKQAQKTSTIKVGKDSGRVKVFVRVRPPRPQENSRKEPIAVNVKELSSQIHVADPKHSWEKTFNFDHVFPKEATNPEVCSTISRPLVNAALNGFNGTLMAYGQTGSGKTHTLMAPDGITAGVIERCFKRITQDERHDYKVTMSYLQIYQEKIYDLLNSTNKVELSLREHPVKGVYVENLSEFVVRSPSEVLNLLTVGKKRLVFAETKMNRNSSRSHSVCQLTIERTLNKNKIVTEGSSKHGATTRDSKEVSVAGSSKSSEDSGVDSLEEVAEENGDTEDDSFTKMVAFDDDVLIRGRIYLCDLAGSERLKKTQAEGERLSEAQHINSSLLELGNVIQALAEGKKTHVPFRNSTLTRLLQESLGGNCKTSLVVCVSPTMGDVSETKSALFFGSRAMKITNTAYVNVEVDYKRLSEDLSKIVDMREKDLEELKQSYENRIERLKHEAETTVANAMAETDKVVASVKSLYENEQSDLQSDIESLNSRLEEEMTRTANLQDEMTMTKCTLEEDMFRTRSTLLMDIISMQIFYALKDLSLDDDLILPENELKQKDGFTRWSVTKSKLLENTDLLLELLQSYLNVLNFKGEKLLDNCGSLKSLIGAEDLLDEGTLLRDTEDVTLYLTNKTDDDKVVASSRCNESLLESHNAQLTEEKVPDGEEHSSLRDKLVSLKSCVDGDALNFLKKAFELDLENEGKTTDSRQNVYKMIQEFMKQRNSVLDSQKSQELSRVADALTLLDHCQSHVIIDKALQSAMLVLENNNITRRCHDIQKQKNVLEDENETLRKQIQSLQQETEKLNGKLNETSTTLCVVKKSKEQLEDDLSSVFQLHNMQNSERKVEKEVSWVENSTFEGKLQVDIATLVENNTKLQETLEVTEHDKENLKSELTSVKRELQREKETNLRSQQHDKSTQTERDESMTLSLNDHAVNSQDRDFLQGILSSLHGDYSSSLEKAVFAAQTNDLVDISSLRAVINQRLGEEWSLVILENAKMKSELDTIRGRINEEKQCFESEWTKSKLKEEKGGETIFEEDGEPNHAKDQKVLEIMIYDQNKVIAKPEMDKLELVKGLQRYKEQPNQLQTDVDAKFETSCELQQEDSLTKDDLETIVKEKLHELSKVHQENEGLRSELDLLRSTYNSLERENNNSNESGEMFEQALENSLSETKTNLATSVTPQMNEKCTVLEGHLAVSIKENNEFKEKLTELEHKLCKIQQEKDAITEQNIALEKRMREQQDNSERALTVEREQKTNFEKQLQVKTREFEEEKTLRKFKENCLSKVETELAETKESSEKLMQERSNEYELEKDSMIKEINGLRCLQGLPTLKPVSNSERAMPRKDEEKDAGLVNAEKRPQIRKNNKLNSELTRAKEQLVRLRAELTMSNMQTRNLGTQLSSLREDSTKLEAELSTVRGFPKNSGQRRNSLSCYDETVRLEIELAEAKEKIIDLQEKLLSIYKEKFALEEKIMSLEGQRNTDAQISGELCSTNSDHELDSDWEQTKELEFKIDLLEAERAHLKRDLENTNADRSRLEGIELCVQQLVSLEDEQLRLKSRLKKWAQNAVDEQCINEAAISTNKLVESSHLKELRELSAENCSLQVEANTLKETIAELESDLAALKLKISIKDTTHEATADKKAVATLLVAVKQERAELQEALNDMVIGKEDLEEQLSEMKMKYARLQREFAMTSIIKDDLELEVLSLKRANLTRGLSNLTQSSEECKSEMSDCCADDLMPVGVNGVDATGKKTASPGGGRKKALGGNNRKTTVTTRNHRDSEPASSSGTTKSPSKLKSNDKKTPLQGKHSVQRLQSTPKKVSGRRSLPSSPSTQALGTNRARSITDDDQSMTDNPQHPAISYDLIRIDDVRDEALHADADCINSGLLRQTPKGERENPEGMEHDVTNACSDKGDKPAQVDTEDNTENLLNDSIELDDHWNSNESVISETDSSLTQPAEVLVKTTWSIKNIFRRQKSLPLPDHKLGALKQ